MAGRLCTVCSDSAAKYKCPKCEAGYCSVKCFRVHKTEPCQAPATGSRGPPPAGDAAGSSERNDDEEAHRLTAEDLQKLGGSEHVKQMLADPDIRALVEAARRDPDPVQAVRLLRQRPDFERLAQALIGATDRQQ
ncbi:hypothetical protein GGF46_004589 [Coemansia sp. RSA 552]|nr:hypothetical protein GGF46_004589 [Coemansia sp. RSA 552]